MGQGLVQNFSYQAFLGRFVDLVGRKQYGEEDKEPDWRGQNQRDDLVLMVELLACLHFFFLLIKKVPDNHLLLQIIVPLLKKSAYSNKKHVKKVHVLERLLIRTLDKTLNDLFWPE